MEEGKITLDKKAFRVLASESRIGILKSLDERRKTLSELSKEFGLSPPTVKEHLGSLKAAGLIKLKDDGHKWKYYELTCKGKGVLHPGETRIWILLGLSTVGVFLFLNNLIQRLRVGMTFSGEGIAERAADAGKLTQTPPPGAESSPSTAAPAVSHLMVLDLAGIVFLSVLAGLSIGLLVWKRRSVL